MFQKLSPIISKKYFARHIISLGAPVVLSVFILGLISYAQTVPATPKRAKLVTQASPHLTLKAVPSQPVVTTPAPTPAPVTPPPVAAKPPVTSTAKPQPVVTPSPASNVSGLTPATQPAPAQSQTPAPSTTTGYLSTNWSGYLATNSTFTAISGAWVATVATGNGVSTSADSTWIGIGGVTSGDLIQVGTQNVINANGQVSATAFYELLPGFEQNISSIIVTPGDSMTAVITQVSSGQWTITINDVTNGETYSLNVAYASSLSSAEWIEEDPSYSFRQQIPFDNFHQAVFTAGTTVANGVSGTIATSSALPVTMINGSGQAIAVPSALSGGAFTVVP